VRVRREVVQLGDAMMGALGHDVVSPFFASAVCLQRTRRRMRQLQLS